MVLANTVHDMPYTRTFQPVLSGCFYEPPESTGSWKVLVSSFFPTSQQCLVRSNSKSSDRKEKPILPVVLCDWFEAAARDG